MQGHVEVVLALHLVAFVHEYKTRGIRVSDAVDLKLRSMKNQLLS